MLKGKQKNLDKNNNGRIDAEDFKLMKASTGKSVRGYGAARTSGSGLLDEQMAPGKVINARVGKSIRKDPTKPISSVKPKVGRYSSMEEMRKAKGFKPGETPEAFNKRRAAEKLAKTASRAGTIGKIALGIAGAGIAAKEYLRRKENKELKKKGITKSPFTKMGGGMIKKYSKGMTDKTFTDPKTAMIAHSMKTNDKISQRDREAAKILEKQAPKGVYSSIMSRKKAFDKVKASKKIVGKMSGGMMNKPMGYKTGTSVMARGCKLGRKKATKLT